MCFAIFSEKRILMRFSRPVRFKLFTALSLFAFSPFAFTDTIDRENDGQDIDVAAVREWMNTKRQVSIKEIGGNLSLSGEVRTEFQKTGETNKGISQRGEGTKYPSSTYDVAVNIMLDYRNDRTWSAIKLEFDNDAGIFSGTTNKIKLSKAYFGARAFEGDSYYADFEAGRRKLGNIFDSKLQFSSFFDGVLLKYDQSFERIGDFYLHAGVFVINEKVNQYGYVGETGLMNIAGSGFYTKFSLIDWDTKEEEGIANKRRFDFIVSQLILGYKFYPAKLQKQVTIYLSGLYNFNAKKLDITDHQKANWGSYIGFSIGELKRKGDWALDANYQFLAAQCVPDFDASGVGLGNVNNSGFYTTELNNTTLTTKSNAGGNVNFRGVSITLDYLLSNNLNLQQQWLQSVTLDDDIGPYRKFKQYEIEFIYGF
jgi:hypothetical protein